MAIEAVFLLQGKPFAHGSASRGCCGFAETEVDRNVARLSLISTEKPPPVVLGAAFPCGLIPSFFGLRGVGVCEGDFRVGLEGPSVGFLSS